MWKVNDKYESAARKSGGFEYRANKTICTAAALEGSSTRDAEVSRLTAENATLKAELKESRLNYQGAMADCEELEKQNAALKAQLRE